jgi:hypothetical protein
LKRIVDPDLSESFSKKKATRVCLSAALWVLPEVLAMTCKEGIRVYSFDS